MKVLQLCLSVGRGGLELYVFRSYLELLKREIDCVAVVSKNTFLQKLICSENLPTINLNRQSHNFPLFSARKLASIIDRECIDVIHIHWGKDLFMVSLAKRMASRSVKIVYTRQMNITRNKKDPYHRFVYGNVDLYISITDELKRLAQSFLPMPPENVIRLYYGVKSPPEMSPQQRDTLRLSWFTSKPRFIVGIVGRIEEEKGQRLVIKALKKLLQKDCSISLLIVGPAMQQSYLADLEAEVQSLGLSDSVRFIGSHSNPVTIMAAMDCLVLATRKETFGLVLIEAMRAGVSVIGSNSGGVPEIINDGETGLLFEPGDEADLSEKIELLYQDNDYREKISEAGKLKADREFCHSVHYDSLITIFKKLVTA